MSTLDIQDVLNGISELFSMIIFIFGLWHDQIFEELRKGWSIANEIVGDLLLPLFLFMEASLGCDVYVCNFGIALYWMLVVMALLLITQNFFFFTICNLYLCCCHSKMKTSTSSYRWSSCPAAMGCSPLYFMNFTSTWYQERLILYSLYLISGPCSFSKFIACCITCHRNGTGSFSLMSPYISILNSKVSLYPATTHALVSSSMYEILWDILIPTNTIAMRVFILVAVTLSLPHCCLSLWKYFISICLVHSRTWYCKFLHTLQYSIFTSSWHCFSNSPAPSVVSLHFRNTFSLLSYICMSYSSSLMLSRSFSSQYCFQYMYSFTCRSRAICFHGSICFR